MKREWFLSPLAYLALFIFFTLTSLNLEVELFKQIHLEMLLVLGVLFFSALSYRDFCLDLRTIEFALVAAFLALAPLFASLANGDYLAILENEEYRSWIKALVVSPVIYGYFRRSEQKPRLIDCLLISLTVFGVIFLYRYYVLGEAREYDLRPTLSTKNGDPNFICTFLAVGVPLGLYQMFEAIRRKRTARSLYYALTAAFLTVGAVITQSRMGLISIAVAVAYLLARAKLPVKRSRLIFGAVGIAGTALVFYGAALGHRFSTINDESSHGRVKSYINGAKLFIQSPYFGNGWDTSPQSYFHNAGYPLFSSDPDTHALAVHNTPLQILADLGSFGFLAYLGLVLFVLRGIRREKNELSHFVAASFLALILNLFTLPLETKDFALLFLAALAALSGAPGTGFARTTIPPSRPRSPLGDGARELPAH